MAGGLVALLDDVAGLARLAAASLDDVGAATARAGSKALGVVVDDAAVTPRYVTGFHPSRELPVIGRIALGSLRNKLLILLPVALLLSSFLPWAVTPLLMLGGAYLAFEATEKIVEAVTGHAPAAEADMAGDAKTIEDAKVAGAVRTDLILSAEIMAIALASVADQPVVARALILAAVGIGITVGVYGVVGLLVKMDDIGLAMTRLRAGALRAVGRGLVRGMPLVMRALGIVGTAAMLWVGGGILVHGLEDLGAQAMPRAIHHLAAGTGNALLAWIVTALSSAAVASVVGGAIVVVIHLVARLRGLASR